MYICCRCHIPYVYVLCELSFYMCKLFVSVWCIKSVCVPIDNAVYAYMHIGTKRSIYTNTSPKSFSLSLSLTHTHNLNNRQPRRRAYCHCRSRPSHSVGPPYPTQTCASPNHKKPMLPSRIRSRKERTQIQETLQVCLPAGMNGQMNGRIPTAVGAPARIFNPSHAVTRIH